MAEPNDLAFTIRLSMNRSLFCSAVTCSCVLCRLGEIIDALRSSIRFVMESIWDT